jgi:uncharacterized membrane protein
VDPLVIGLVAISAGLHVAWNVRLKTGGDHLRAATVGNLAAAAVIIPVGLAVWWSSGAPAAPIEGVALGLASGVVEAAYFVFLAGAYRRGDLSVVYPIARGTAPLLAVVVGVVLLGERLDFGGALGVAALLAGFLWLQRPWRAVAAALDRTKRSGAGFFASPVPFALATGVTIATYTAIDRVGTRIIDPIPYAAILWATSSLVLVAWVVFADGGGLVRGGGAAVRHATTNGLLSLGAYLCILGALSVAPMSGVAPLRESATVFAVAWASVRLGEAGDRAELGRRVGASVLIVGGALLLAIGR